MSAQLEVPQLDDLADLGIMVERPDSPGVASVAAISGDGGSVTLTWDEIAGSVSVRWLEGDRERLVLERETASRVAVRGLSSGVQFRVWSESDGVRGELVVSVGERVSVQDSLLRA
jgi:hypothetical protein